MFEIHDINPVRARIRRATSRAKYAAIGAAVGGALGGLVGRNAASTGAGLGALVGAVVGEKRATVDSAVGRFSGEDDDSVRGRVSELLPKDR